ncbi:WD40-repeat-containing domain protein [Ephemerocybe angulata]|uniref:WD40-repeat-containing domain protein n=1 Tax=Ephemerocybe angulata TaxID=980116 RepID=A0A8H6ICJ4_9AGAR|nr:WD40-repeat-containing domain protein [Tulosesus angulatus]
MPKPNNSGARDAIKFLKKARGEDKPKAAERAQKRARIASPPPSSAAAASKGKAPAKGKAAAGPSTSKPKASVATPAPKPTTSTAKGKGKSPKSPAEEKPAPLPSTFKVVAGSYEKLLYGLSGSTSVTEEGKLEFHMKPMFMFPAHASCIKSVAASPQGGKWLATGSADEIIKIWDLRRKKEVGGLMHHEGSITHLSFPSRSFLLSASEDGTLCIFRARDWAVLRALKGHKGRVNAIAVHPSGKVALSVGRDRTLRMWDLMRGKGVASTKIGKEGETCQWSTDGSLFAVQAGSSIDIYSSTMELLHIINHPARLHDLRFCKRVNGEGELLFVAAEDKEVSIYAVHEDKSKEPALFAQLVGHENRVKQLRTLEISLPEKSGRSSTTIVSTVSSDGNIHVYDINDVPNVSEAKEIVKVSPVATYSTNGTRLTCLTLADGDVEGAEVGGKRKRSEGEEDDEEDEEEDDLELDEEEEEEEVVDEDDGGFGSGWEDEEEEEEEEVESD